MISMLDVLDIKILKYIYKDRYRPCYVTDMAAILKTKKSKVRLRLKKLCKMEFIKEVKTYPRHYVHNEMLYNKISEIKIPVMRC